MKNPRNHTLAELLDSTDSVIYRNAMSIHKRLRDTQKPIRCNQCYRTYKEDELEIIDDMRACTKCKTDEYLMDII